MRATSHRAVVCDARIGRSFFRQARTCSGPSEAAGLGWPLCSFFLPTLLQLALELADWEWPSNKHP